MKATDLMIGDWVIAYGKKTQVVWVGNIHKLAVRGFPSEFYEEEIEPIPLTPEILEKNGFEVRDRYIWERKDNYYCVKLNIAPKIEIDGEILDEHPPILLEVDGATFNLNIIVDYVHELQHALKLCGIDKTIEL